MAWCPSASRFSGCRTSIPIIAGPILSVKQWSALALHPLGYCWRIRKREIRTIKRARHKKKPLVKWIPS
jgi:hypothetical protein